MMRRPVLAALAALTLTACPTRSGDRTCLIEKDGHVAIAFQHGGKVELYPLPDNPTVVIDGKQVPLNTSVSVMPHCPCTRQECQIYCRPMASIAWPGTGGVLDPGGRTMPPAPAPAPATAPAPAP